MPFCDSSSDIILIIYTDGMCCIFDEVDNTCWPFFFLSIALDTDDDVDLPQPMPN